MGWVLTTGLATWRRELDEVFPGRDRTSSGTIGNQAHSTSTSGHNPDLTGRAEYKDGDRLDEVRASDEDSDLVPGAGIDWMERVIQFVVTKARRGEYVPFRYLIYKGRIWSRSDGWKTRVYNGANKHDKHAHFSGDYSQKADGWTGRLGLASIRQGSTVAENNGWQDVTEHGDGREVTNETALQNVAELFRLLPDWADWWFVRWVKAITEKVDKIKLSTDQTGEIRNQLSALGREVAQIGQVPAIDYAALAKAMFDEMDRRAAGGSGEG